MILIDWLIILVITASIIVNVSLYRLSKNRSAMDDVESEDSELPEEGQISNNWMTVQSPGTRQAHCVPINDMYKHYFSDTCWCDPVAEIDGVTEVIVHNAADKREEYDKSLCKPH